MCGNAQKPAAGRSEHGRRHLGCLPPFPNVTGCLPWPGGSDPALGLFPSGRYLTIRLLLTESTPCTERARSTALVICALLETNPESCTTFL
jgi:hypothetical protein